MVRTTFLLFVSLFVVGCQGEKAGDPCDKFFQNTCKAPLSCVHMADRSVCAGSCETIWPKEKPVVPGEAPEMPKQGCKNPAMEMAEVRLDKNGTDLGSMGCYCLPTKAK